jgi:hypothetical protein
MNKKEIIDFIKSLEESKIVAINSHQSKRVVETIGAVISMSEEEHDIYQEETPNQSVLLFFSEYQDWKETYIK